MFAAAVPYIAVLFIGSLMTLGLAVYAWSSRKRSAAASAFAGLAAGSTLYALGYGVELLQGTVSGILIGTRIEYLGISFLPVFWVLTAARYTGQDHWLTPSVRGALFGFSSLTLILVWTNGVHGLFYRNLGLNEGGPFPLLEFTGGPWYWIHQAFANLGLLIGSVLLLKAFLSSPPGLRQRQGLMLAGGLIPWIFYLVYLAGGSPHGIDLSPFGIALAALIIGFGILRFGFLNLVPVARERIFESMKDGVIVLTPDDRLADFNGAAARLFPDLIRGKLGRKIESLAGLPPEIGTLLRMKEAPEIEIRIGTDSQARFFRAHLDRVTTRQGSFAGRAIVFNDTTAQVRLLGQLREQASVDDLTGAFNRRHFLDFGRREITRAKRYGHPLSVIILDLDRFKSINDSWGHEAGDRALQAAARTLKTGLREADVLCRHGGEEFAILLPETPPFQACGVAERLCKALADSPISVDADSTITLTASFGVAGKDHLGEDSLESLIRAADETMYEAKAAGRNRVRCAGPTGA